MLLSGYIQDEYPRVRFVAEQHLVPPLDRGKSCVACTQIKYIGQTQAASDGSSLDMPPSSTMAAKGVHPHLENLKTKVREVLGCCDCCTYTPQSDAHIESN